MAKNQNNLLVWLINGKKSEQYVSMGLIFAVKYTVTAKNQNNIWICIQFLRLSNWPPLHVVLWSSSMAIVNVITQSWQMFSEERPISRRPYLLIKDIKNHLSYT